MRHLHLALTGTDTHWLDTVREAVNSLNQAGTCHLTLTTPDPEHRVALGPDVLLIDATAEPNIAARVSEYTAAGWREIIVVAANPNWREAHALLQGAGARDYWPKSYDVEAVRWRLAELLREVAPAAPDDEEDSP